MKRLAGLLIILFLFSCSINNFSKDSLTFELRLAETKPDSNLIEMTFYNSDQHFFVRDSVFLSNAEIISTDIIDWQTHPKVLVNLDEEGQKIFSDFTKRNIGRNAAIIIDNKLVSAPRINAPITEGKLIIVGYFNHQEAKSIAAGILPQ